MTREPGDLPASGRSCPVQGMAKARYLSVWATNGRWRPHRFAWRSLYGVRLLTCADRRWRHVSTRMSR